MLLNLILHNQLLQHLEVVVNGRLVKCLGATFLESRRPLGWRLRNRATQCSPICAPDIAFACNATVDGCKGMPRRPISLIQSTKASSAAGVR